MSVSHAAICFIACHGGPADHFATFSKELSDVGTVEIFASGPALKKFQERGVEVKGTFSLDNISVDEEDRLVKQIAKACEIYSVIITDVGHAFTIKIHKAMASHVCHLAYYDNPERYVPGGYSLVASDVMVVSKGVLFANGHLAHGPIFREPGQAIDFGNIVRWTIGYYPVMQAEKIANRRLAEHAVLRQQLLVNHNMADTGQKILVYFGGNNDEYFSKAFPAFLSLLADGIEKADLSNIVFVIQQHPGAKAKNLDGKRTIEWVNTYGKLEKAPTLIISDSNSDDSQVVADGAFYYQTSMGPQFALANIPVVQIGHETYEDVLVSNRVAPSVTDVAKLLQVLQTLKPLSDKDFIYQALGVEKEWLYNLKRAVNVVPPSVWE